MSSITCLNELSLALHYATKAVIRWQEVNIIAIILNTRFNREAAFFKIAYILFIMSLKIIKNLTILIVIGEAFKSITLSLNFILNLYSGIRGKLIKPLGNTAAPPLYNKTTSRPPPLPPLIKLPLQSRVEALETKNEKLKQQNKELNKEFTNIYNCLFLELYKDIDRVEGVVNFILEGQVHEELLKVIKNVIIKEIMTRLANRYNSPCTRVASAVANIPQDKRLIASPPAPVTPISLIALIAIGTVSQPVVVLPKSTIRAIGAFGIKQQLALIIVSTDAEP
ncbi:hypothetical protein QL093DRAFT_2560365 [Fusarium oxysporum]|nr:hypothetical protein QL093DRAFT_2560365 [Fusarium oxysporum]